MTGLLLDTNVLSEAGKPVPDPRMRSFLKEQSNVWLSVVTLHEIEFGICLLQRGRKRSSLESAIESVKAAFGNKILGIGAVEARQAANLRAEAHKHGRDLPLPDALIAATAHHHGLTLATRNISAFDYLGVDVIDPWGSPSR